MKKRLKKLNRVSNKENNRFYKEVYSRGKIALLSHPIIFYPLLLGAIYIDYVPIRDAMLKASSSWSVLSLTAFALLTAFIINAGITIVISIAKMESRTLLKNIIVGSVILTIISFYILSCGIKWSTRYDSSGETNYSSNADPALQALISSQSLEDSSWVDTTEPPHDIGTDFVCLLSCLAPIGTSVLICSIGYDPDPFRKERYQNQRRRTRIVKLLSENESILVEMNTYLKEIEKQQELIEQKITSEKEQGSDLFQNYLEVHALYMLAMNLGSAEALTYLIQENAYVEKLFPST